MTRMEAHPARWRKAVVAFITLATALAALSASDNATSRPLIDSPLLGYQWEDAAMIQASNLNEYNGSMYWVAQEATGAAEFWNDGYIGTGVDVAVIDSGVLPVQGLTYPGKVINGPDLSFESQAENLIYMDTFGHGTHMAGIIAGRDDGADTVQRGEEANFLGMAPGARIVNVKVADSAGAVDATQVIAAIDWIVQHRSDNGMNIRVLNLSYGTDGSQNSTVDPLAQAVERAWESGGLRPVRDCGRRI
jgi:serine protease AprX